MSENIQPSSDDKQIVEDLAKEESSEKLPKLNNKELTINLEQNRFECRSCGYIYDPIEGNKKLNIPKNTPFSLIDGNIFACPVCRAGKNLYKDIGPREKPSGFEENLTYGFGFNSLPPGQKNILIFGGLAFAAACFLSLYSLH
ncbi:probable rubredoxin [Prochlorococcus marinus str. MIT 9515]|uniref:Probable rubredoxin n=1 Tax=Prochlorococcus marinus (strain MIT 9515) TaxID=167542 RepID=A2BUS6_PROM5|nr:rubredoxin [Prochlorococcus marinus]ABM71537.1 probable rubredoxin [Prochlorococcus marinus str. MIT 9515]